MVTFLCVQSFRSFMVLFFYSSDSDEEDIQEISDDSDDEIFNEPSTSRKHSGGRQTATRSRSSKPSPSSRSSKPSGKRGVMYSDSDEDDFPRKRKR